MSKVVALHGGSTGQRQVVDFVVRDLERLLEMAKSGEILSIVSACTYYDGAAGYSVAGYIGGNSLLGALARAQHNVLHRVEAD